MIAIVLVSVTLWGALIDAAAERHGVPADLIAAIMAIESGGNPNAIGPAGEIGLMQILPSTGRLLGVSPSQLRDPAINLDTGARYLALELRACGGDVACSLRGWNGGPRCRAGGCAGPNRYAAAVLARRSPVERAVAIPEAPIPVVVTVSAPVIAAVSEPLRRWRSRWAADVQAA